MRLVLLPVVLPFPSMSTPKTVPLNSPVSVKSTTPPEALNNTGINDRRQRQGAGRTLETPGSTCDLIVRGKVGHPSREIYANG